MLETPGFTATQVRGATAGRTLLAPAPRYLVFTLLIASLAVNAAIVLVGLPRTGGVIPGTNGTLDYSVRFGDLYNRIADNLYEGHGYRVDSQMGETILREPGYPLLIAGMYRIVGHSSQVPRITCILLAFGSALLLLELTRKITGDRTIALIAALMFLLYPGTLVAEARAGNDIPCIFTMLLFMVLLYHAMEKKSTWLYGVAGVSIGIAVLVRSEVMLFPVFVLGYLLITSTSWKARGKAVLQMLALAAGLLVAMSPWILRNYLLVHKVVLTDTLGGVAMQEGLFTCEHLPHYHDFYLTQRAAGAERADIARQLGLRFQGSYYYQFFYTPQDEMTFNRALLDHVLATYRTDPGVLAHCAADNMLFRFWFLGKTSQATQLNMLVQLPVLALSLGGIIVLYKLGLLQKAAVVLLYIAYIPLIHAPIIAHARHSMLVIAFLAVPAATFLGWVWHFQRTQHPRVHFAGTGT